jgi:phosphoglycolate phosphatase-like HAD superfamily hydrolase
MFDKFKHVIWDWNGTLLADQRLSYDIFVDIFAAVGVSSPDFGAWREIVHFPISDFYKSFLPSASDSEIASLMGAWAKQYEARRRECGLQPGALDLLRVFSSQGKYQSILSAHTKAELIEAAQEQGVLSYFRSIAALEPGMGGGSKIKIGLALIEEIESSLGLSRADHVIVGDSSHDAEVAESLGIRCVLVSQGVFSHSRLEQLGHPVLSSLESAVAV